MDQSKFNELHQSLLTDGILLHVSKLLERAATPMAQETAPSSVHG